MTAPDWAERYRSGNTPWDLGRPHPELVRLLAGNGAEPVLGRPARALVPGCGRGHDALALARAGWAVTAVDTVSALEPLLSPQLAPHGGRFLAADALTDLGQPPAELLWEHTFFCALPPPQRPRYGAMARRQVAAGGRLCALVFPVDRPLELGGPPWRTTTADLAQALGAGFELLLDEAVVAAGPGRAWRERLAVFTRLRP